MGHCGFISVLATFLLGIFMILGVGISAMVQHQVEIGGGYQQTVELDWLAKGAAERAALELERDPGKAEGLSVIEDHQLFSEQVEEPGGVITVIAEARRDEKDGWICVQGWAARDGDRVQRCGHRRGMVRKKGDHYAWVGFLP